MPDFEETLQAEALAPKAFLEADARRRFARALRFRCRPLKELHCRQDNLSTTSEKDERRGAY